MERRDERTPGHDERGGADRGRHRLVQVEDVEALALERAPDAEVRARREHDFGSEPFAGTITERPTGMTFAGGWSWRPTRGWSARVN